MSATVYGNRKRALDTNAGKQVSSYHICRAYPIEDKLQGRLLPFPANMRLVEKSLPGTNDLAYYKSKLMTIKSFITLATDYSYNFLPLLKPKT
jgi:hypothetical protein